MSQVFVELAQFTIVGDTAIHGPTQARFFAKPGRTEVERCDWGNADRRGCEYDKDEIMCIAKQLLAARLSITREWM